MFSVHVKEAERRKQPLKLILDQGDQQVAKAAHSFSDTLLTAISNDVSTAYNAERQIETELRNIERLLVSNARQNEQWMALLSRLTTELKELGDITNWVESLAAAADEIKKLAAST